LRFLEPVNHLNQIAGKIDVHQNKTSRTPPLSMSDNALRCGRGCPSATHVFHETVI
jgi:hypothetical protein